MELFLFQCYPGDGPNFSSQNYYNFLGDKLYFISPPKHGSCAPPQVHFEMRLAFGRVIRVRLTRIQTGGARRVHLQESDVGSG